MKPNRLLGCVRDLGLDHEQVKIATGIRFCPRMRAKQDDSGAFRRRLGDPSSCLGNGCLVDHRQEGTAGRRCQEGSTGEGPDHSPATLTRLLCGIVGYVGARPCEELLLSGLEKLEYRGYDSAGLSVLADGEVESVHAVGNLANLRAAVQERAKNGAGPLPPAETGIAHTRWATHGRVTEANAHPHDDNSGQVHIVLNGIVENHSELRRRLQGEGQVFTSETDAEVVAHLIAGHYDGDLAAAVRAAYAELRGHYAFVAMHAGEPQRLVGARKECPLVAGVGEGESFLASAIPAFLADTRIAMPI